MHPTNSAWYPPQPGATEDSSAARSWEIAAFRNQVETFAAEVEDFRLKGMMGANRLPQDEDDSPAD